MTAPQHVIAPGWFRKAFASLAGATFAGVVKLPDGTAAAPSLARATDATDGVFFGDDYVGVAVDGTARARVNDSGELLVQKATRQLGGALVQVGKNAYGSYGQYFAGNDDGHGYGLGRDNVTTGDFVVAQFTGDGDTVGDVRLRIATGVGGLATFDGSISLPTASYVRANNTAKAWGMLTVTASTPTLQDSYGISSISDLNVGSYRWNWTTNFPTFNYAVVCCAEAATGRTGMMGVIESGAQAVGSVVTDFQDAADANIEAKSAYVVAFGV
ncbi:MAG: hypothetical protein ACKVSF_10240 [Alphaproteobacteria bacterium]